MPSLRSGELPAPTDATGYTSHEQFTAIVQKTNSPKQIKTKAELEVGKSYVELHRKPSGKIIELDRFKLLAVDKPEKDRILVELCEGKLNKRMSLADLGVAPNSSGKWNTVSWLEPA
jgi:hypothetical protein